MERKDWPRKIKRNCRGGPEAEVIRSPGRGSVNDHVSLPGFSKGRCGIIRPRRINTRGGKRGVAIGDRSECVIRIVLSYSKPFEGFSTLTDRSSCPDNPEPGIRGIEGRVERVRSFD